MFAKKAFTYGVGGKGAAADFDGLRDLLDEVISKFERGLNDILQFLFIAGDQPYFAVRAIHDAFHGIDGFCHSAAPERCFLPVSADGVP